MSNDRIRGWVFLVSLSMFTSRDGFLAHWQWMLATIVLGTLPWLFRNESDS